MERLPEDAIGMMINSYAKTLSESLLQASDKLVDFIGEKEVLDFLIKDVDDFRVTVKRDFNLEGTKYVLTDRELAKIAIHHVVISNLPVFEVNKEEL